MDWNGFEWQETCFVIVIINVVVLYQ
jgi:hypothetical protein